ncbi:MAG TPA: hypothetical protein VGF80_04070 [Galbitalea sp.]|jgi:hypothetical protein
MTKDRARKRAARERANLTGERYVVARRNTEASIAIEPSMNPVTRVLHDWTHRIPGVPAHQVHRAHQAQTARGSRTREHTNSMRGHKNPTRVYREPRVLVEWQNWIARRVGALPPKN